MGGCIALYKTQQALTLHPTVDVLFALDSSKDDRRRHGRGRKDGANKAEKTAFGIESEGMALDSGRGWWDVVDWTGNRGTGFSGPPVGSVGCTGSREVKAAKKRQSEKGSGAESKGAREGGESLLRAREKGVESRTDQRASLPSASRSKLRGSTDAASATTGAEPNERDLCF